MSERLDLLRALRAMGAVKVVVTDDRLEVAFGAAPAEEQPERPPQPTESEFVRDTVKTMLASSEDS